MKKAGLLFLCIFAFAASPSLFGQAASGTATIAGVVTDPTGAVVPAAGHLGSQRRDECYPLAEID